MDLTLSDEQRLLRESVDRFIAATYDAERDLLVSTAPEATSMGVAPDAWRGGSNVPGLDQKLLEATRARLRELEALVEGKV